MNIPNFCLNLLLKIYRDLYLIFIQIKMNSNFRQNIYNLQQNYLLSNKKNHLNLIKKNLGTIKSFTFSPEIIYMRILLEKLTSELLQS